MLYLVFIIISIIIILIYLYLENSYISEIQSFFNELNCLKNNYIPHSEIEKIRSKYHSLRIYTFLIISEEFRNFRKTFDNIEKIIDKYNEDYIKKELEENKDYFDNMFDYSLDEEQRRAIITDDNNNLIIAGAGSGKTTTIIGKTKYLIEKKNIDPDKIITISFTNAAKDNFVKKLNNEKVKCFTFHKLGKEILEDGKNKIEVFDDLDRVIRDYICKEIYKDKRALKKLIKYYAYFMHFNTDISNQKGCDLETLKNKYYRIEKLKTLKYEKVKSEQELIIANFLFLNGINYEYEAKYKYATANENYRQYHPDFYLVDYDIYLEHFGITKDNHAYQYNKDEEKKYLKGIDYKRKLHKYYNTKLIETYSYEFATSDFLKKLKEKLIDNGIKLEPISLEKLENTIQNISNEEIYYFCGLVVKFIKMFKGRNYSSSKFEEFYLDAKSHKNYRDMLLISILNDAYLYYQKFLYYNKYIDYDDMINKAIYKINKKYDKEISYIIIDEFQDVSISRYNLIRAIQKKTNAKIVAVGDDWQSIYRFTGCDLDIFVNFKKYFEFPKIMYISNTYRNFQDLLDLSSKFILRNDKQLYKSLKSIKNRNESSIELYYYHNDIMFVTKNAIKKLREFGCKKVAILGRNNADIKKYGLPVSSKSLVDMSKLFDFDVIFTTVHRAKGLEFDGVIIANLEDSLSGFPNKMADDPILKYVSNTCDNSLYEEERRLFYVALTRTKNKVILLVPYENSSCFVGEIDELSHALNNPCIKEYFNQ